MLKTLQANGYRLLNDFTADFGRLTVVVGANACGKSTLLDCLGFMSHVVEGGGTDPVTLHGGLSSILSAMPEQRLLRVGACFDNEGGLPWGLLPRKGMLNYEVSLARGPDGRALLVDERLEGDGGDGGTLESYLLNTPNQFLVYDHDRKEMVPYDQAPSGPVGPGESKADVLQKIQQTRTEPVFRLAQMQFLQKYPVLSSAREALRFLSIYPAFDVSGASPIRVVLSEIRPGTVLLPRGENLGAVLHEILTRYENRDVAQEIRSFLEIAYPQFEEITAETAYGGTPARVLVRVAEKGLGRPVEIWELSDGMLRFLFLAVALLSPGVRSLVAIDEPEAGLHPKLLPIVGDMIKAASERTQVIVTTHSPDLLDRFAIDDIAVMSREESRAIWERPGSRKALVRMLESTLGGTVGDLLRSGELEGAAQ